jgi:alpha-L-arabinofuranosidase
MAQTGTVTIQANEPGANISPNLFGIFFEEINMAGDGGIYAEQIRNRSFEDGSTPVNWTLVTNGIAAGSFALDTSLPLSPSNTHSLLLTMTSGTGSVGAVNNGYYGIHLTNGVTYNLAFYARAASGFSGNITVSLESANGATTYAQSTVSGLTTTWQHFTATLVPNATDPLARLALRISPNGSVYLDFVSLFPAVTFNNRTNGLRPDLANLLVNLKPSFMRFPGGNWVDGYGTANAYHWELTIGDPANRTPRNDAWGYMVDNGLGFHEYLQMCEDLGATPLLCVNAGMDGNQVAVPPSQLGPWIQEALDAIQYANGETNTYWGAQRATNGHPAPFNLQYMEIGNENHGASYNTNYGMFYYAIKSNYPSLHVIVDSPNYSSDPIPTSAPLEIVDEHFYSSATYIAQAATRYDSYSRNGPKIFVGEYASAYATPPSTFPATLSNAVAEAACMTGFERNSDLVQMSCYAPLFCNLNNPDWYPDLIYFNGTNVYGTPSYYVQQMFSLNRGDVALPTSVSVSGNPLYVSSSLVRSSGQIIVKAVNFNNSVVSTTFNLNGVASIAPIATTIQLTGNAGDTNWFGSRPLIFPVTNSIGSVGTNFTVSLPANSLTIFKLQGSGFGSVTNLQFQFVSPIHLNQSVPNTLWGQASGQALNLAGNYAVTYVSMDPTIAVADAYGNVSGTGIGTTAIVVSYAGMSATQSVQVLPMLETRLIHRYSFNDNTANDSVGSANGTFHNGSGTSSIFGGQLNLKGSTSDYVDLGPGIITASNLASGAVTFEAWVSFNLTNTGWSRLFDFGTSSGSSGANYIFLSPNNANNGGSARMAVTDSVGNGDETGFNINNFLGMTNLHVVAVFNPAANRQFLGLYTNGVLAASTSTGNKQIASLNDVTSFLGHSHWSGDPGLNGSIDEFRIYDGELSTNQIVATGVLGPNQVLSTGSPPISLTTTPTNLTLTWPLASAGFTLQTCTNLVLGSWLDVTSPTPQFIGTNYQIALPVTNAMQFFRLSE